MDTEYEIIPQLAFDSILQYIAMEYFATVYLICLITSNSTKYKPPLYNLNKIIFSYDQSKQSKAIFLKSVDLGCQAYIISEDVLPLFLNDFFEIHDKALQRYSNKHIVIYEDILERRKNSRDSNILKQQAVDDIPNILLLEIDLILMKVIFKTTKYSGPNIERNQVIDIGEIKLENFDSIKPALKKIDFFPSKTRNLQGREISLAIFNYMPYTLWTTAIDKTEKVINSQEKIAKTPLHIDGTESWVFLQFCKRINCSLLISLDEENEWGEILDNRTGNGIIGAVVERRAEVGVGALYSWYHESIYLSLSKFISRTGVTCITPKPSLLNPFRTPLLPFSSNLWISVILSFITGIIIRKFLMVIQSKSVMQGQKNTNEDISKISLNILGIFVLQSVKLNSKNTTLLIFFMSMLVLGLLLGNSYSSSLASVLTIPQFEKAIDTVEELAESGMEWGSTHDAWIFSILLATQPMILELLSKFKALSKENLEERAIKQDLSFSIERLPYGHYAIGEYITEDTVYNYQTLTNDIYYELCVAMSTKTWPLLNQLDELILQIFESGIQKFIELDVVLRNTNNKIQMAIERSRHRDTPGPIKLTPLHLSGAFFLLVTGLSFSMLVFVTEIVFNSRKKTSN